MAEQGKETYLGGHPVLTYLNDELVPFDLFYQPPPPPPYQFRNDPYSASLVSAQPFSLFTDLGMTNYYDSVDADIRGTGTNLPINPSGSSSTYTFASASVVSSGSYDFATNNDYATSVSQENASNLGVIPTSAHEIGSQDFVVEFWFNPRQNFGNAPFHMWCFGSDQTTDYVTLQWSNVNGSNRFGFWINAVNTWSTTPFAQQGTDIVNGTWNHIAFSKSGTTARVYLNGNKIGEGTRPATINTPTSGMYQLVGVNTNNNDGLRKNVQDYRVYIGTDKGYTGSTITVPDSIVEKV